MYTRRKAPLLQRVRPLRNAGMSEQLVLDLYIRDIHDEFSE